MSRASIAALVGVAMTAFAANSILCRLALGSTQIDPASFTLVRLLSGAAMLWVVVRIRSGTGSRRGDWRSALGLFVYAAGFSYAYVNLTAGTGALLLFGSVQATMILAGLARGERLTGLQTGGLVLAIVGLVVLVSPGVTQPPLASALLMTSAGIAWGIYSLRGRSGTAPTETTAGNFVLATIPAVALTLATLPAFAWDGLGAMYAVLSGALASGLGYAIWYAALPALRATLAATVQLSVPAIAALGGVFLLDEVMTLRLAWCSMAVLGGIALVLKARRPA